MIITFAGNRIDDPDRSPPRFPSSAVSDVARRVGGLLDENEPDLLVGAAAGGADLVVLSEARRRAIPIHVVLPLTIERFRTESVADQGEEWVERFDETIASAEAMTVDDLSSFDDWYLRGNDLIIATAARLAGTHPIHGLVIAADGDTGVSNDFRQKVTNHGWPVVSIDPGLRHLGG